MPSKSGVSVLNRFEEASGYLKLGYSEFYSPTKLGGEDSLTFRVPSLELEHKLFTVNSPNFRASSFIILSVKCTYTKHVLLVDGI
jgi:hypothetical protein